MFETCAESILIQYRGDNTSISRTYHRAECVTHCLSNVHYSRQLSKLRNTREIEIVSALYLYTDVCEFEPYDTTLWMHTFVFWMYSLVWLENNTEANHDMKNSKNKELKLIMNS